MMLPFACVLPEWPAPATVRALQTQRAGGFSVGSYASMNLGAHCGDDPVAVQRNRTLLQDSLGLMQPTAWLQQVHGTTVVRDPRHGCEADAVWSSQPGEACAVMTADCLPVLFCDDDGTCVAAAHAGWRGLCAGVLEATVKALPAAPSRLMAWMGAAIGPAAFEVGPEVRQQFVSNDPSAGEAFSPGCGDRWQADLYRLARLRLQRCGVERVFGGTYCTYSDPERWFSYRREPRCGRMASLIWLSVEA